MVGSSSRLWQLPYVNLFKFYKIDQQDWSKATKSGDVTTAMDKTVKALCSALMDQCQQKI